jgi:hypothetical protein
MKKFLLFAGEYTPEGGMKDFQASDDNVDALYRILSYEMVKHDWRWWHIVDRDTMNIVSDSKFPEDGPTRV